MGAQKFSSDLRPPGTHREYHSTVYCQEAGTLRFSVTARKAENIRRLRLNSANGEPRHYPADDPADRSKARWRKRTGFRGLNSVASTFAAAAPAHAEGRGHCISFLRWIRSIPNMCELIDSLRIWSGERGRNRTFNLVIKSHLLCQLSYAPVPGVCERLAQITRAKL